MISAASVRSCSSFRAAKTLFEFHGLSILPLAPPYSDREAGLPH
jgi:hypothetical protein